MSTSSFRRALLVIALFTVSACGGDDAMTEDASIDASSMLDAASPIDATAPTDATAPVDATAAIDATTPIDATTSVDAATTDAACAPRTTDTSGIGDDCETDLECPPAYTCQPVNGFVLVQSCQILCARDCDCPGEHTCEEQSDKVATWMQCVGPSAAE